MFGFVGKAISDVWKYAEKAVSFGLDKVESFKDVVAGGIDIDSVEWSGLYDQAEEAKETWSRINGIPGEYTIGSEFAIRSEFDWREKYVMKMKILAEDLETGVVSEQWITVESKNLLTRNEWDYYASEAVTDSPMGYSLDVYAVYEYNLYAKA